MVCRVQLLEIENKKTSAKKQSDAAVGDRVESLQQVIAYNV